MLRSGQLRKCCCFLSCWWFTKISKTCSIWVRFLNCQIVADKAGKAEKCMSWSAAQLLFHILDQEYLGRNLHPSMSHSRGTRTNLTEVYSDLKINWAHVNAFPDSPSLELDSETSGHVCRWIQPPPGGLAQSCFQTSSLVLCVSLCAELSPTPVCCFFKLPSSLWRLQFKAMEVEQLCKCQDTLRSCRHIIGDGGRLFKLV